MTITTKELPQVEFGLLGRTLGHSWSPRIHTMLGSSPYDLVELEPEYVEAFVRTGKWRGLNVTIPYKQTVVPLADEVSERVRRLRAANTLVRRDDGSILAENTDVLGFSWQLECFCEKHFGCAAIETLSGRKALVLGSGGASKAVSMVLSDLGAQVVIISRRGPETYDTLTERHADAFFLVNTTPVGMYPHCPASPLPLETLAALSALRGIIDVVYNPIRTGLMLAADRIGIPSESGLSMLVGQALHSSMLFQNVSLDPALASIIEQTLRKETTNVALIGMPGAGKTSAGRALAHLIGRPFIDLDDAFELHYDMSAAECIRAHGEAHFRQLETEVLADYGTRSGIIMACGGGVVTQERNYDLLRQNSTIVMLDRPLDELSQDGRPVSQAKGIERLAQERMGFYHAWADVVISCTGSAAGDATEIRAILEL